MGISIITPEAVARRLQEANKASQESIQTIALWIMHYNDKASIEIIVDGWLNCFRMATNDDHRITLFYIMNDVVQRAKNKHVDTLIPAFQPAVLTSVSLGRSSEKVKSVMTRCIDIFGERQVFTKASVNAMRNLLKDETGEGDDAYELETDEIIRKIQIFQQGREVVSRGMDIVQRADYSFKDQIKDRMRDRTEASKLENENRQALEQLVSFRHSMETQKKRMLELVEMIELAKRVFSHQLREVTVVEDAYQKFCQGIRDVHRDLKEMERTGVYPAATPPRDAPSPTANDDIYATGVESVLQNLRAPTTRDNLESTDMDIGDDEDEMPPPPLPPSIRPYSTAVGSSIESQSMWTMPPHVHAAGPPVSHPPPPHPTHFSTTMPPMNFAPSVPPPQFLPPPGLAAIPIPTTSGSINPGGNQDGMHSYGMDYEEQYVENQIDYNGGRTDSGRFGDVRGHQNHWRGGNERGHWERPRGSAPWRSGGGSASSRRYSDSRGNLGSNREGGYRYNGRGHRGSSGTTERRY